jgi:hypothetical protein
MLKTADGLMARYVANSFSIAAWTGASGSVDRVGAFGSVATTQTPSEGNARPGGW